MILSHEQVEHIKLKLVWQLRWVVPNFQNFRTCLRILWIGFTQINSLCVPWVKLDASLKRYVNIVCGVTYKYQQWTIDWQWISPVNIHIINWWNWDSTVNCLDVISVYSGECEAGWQCKPRDRCPAFQQKESTLKTLTSLSSEWFELASKLADLNCGGEKNWICCEKGELDNFIQRGYMPLPY